MALSEVERQQLASFRLAAGQVREASIISQGQSIQIRAAPGEPGQVDIFVRLLEDEPFRSLALAIRLVYMKNEPAFFYYICNLVAREDANAIRGRVAEVRRRYDDALKASENALHLDDGLEPEAFSAEEIFEHWLYGIVFHQDEKRRHAVERLASTGAHFTWRVQAIALQLAGRILDLDDIVADFLGEEQLPRITPT